MARQRGADGRGWFERALFAVMGPADLGDLDAPPARRHDPAVDLCRRCGQLWDRHTVIRPSSMTIAQCPPGPPGPPGPPAGTEQ